MVETISISGAKLVALRKNLYWSRDELAQRTGMTRSALQRIEQTDPVRVTAKTMRRIAEGIGIPPEELERKLSTNGDTRVLELPADLHDQIIAIAARDYGGDVTDFLRDAVEDARPVSKLAAMEHPNAKRDRERKAKKG